MTGPIPKYIHRHCRSRAKALLLLLLSVTCILASCADSKNQILTRELERLPCEQDHRFFFPIEFDRNGEIIDQGQLKELFDVLGKKGSQDLYVFVHGWDKTVRLAVHDYADLTCRLYAVASANAAKTNHSTSGQPVMAALFWPSTFFHDSGDLMLLKPGTYFPIRTRAEMLATTGFQNLLLYIQDFSQKHQDPLRLHLVGHSFGDRIVVKGLFRFLTNPRNDPALLFQMIEKLDLVLLLSAMSNDALDTHRLRDEAIEEANQIPTTELVSKEILDRYEDIRKDLSAEHDKIVQEAGKLLEKIAESEESEICPFECQFMLLLGQVGKSQRIDENYAALTQNEARQRNKRIDERVLRAVQSLREFSDAYPPLRVFNVHSRNDWANGLLFPVAALFSADRVACALGSCGAPDHMRATVDAAGHLNGESEVKIAKILNIDATSIISSHTDIYTDGVANLIWQVLSMGDAKRQVTEAESTGYEELFTLATEYTIKGEYDRAIQIFDKAIRLNPNDAVAVSRRGVAYMGKKAYDLAIQDYDEAIRLDPTYFKAFINRGAAFAQKNEYGRAIEDFDEAIRLNPSFAGAFTSRGAAYEAQQEYDRAIQDYNIAIHLDPKGSLALLGRGNAYLGKQEYKLGIQDYNVAIQLDPTLFQAFYNRSIANQLLNKNERAIEDFEEAIRSDPDLSEQLHGLRIIP